MRFAVRLLQLLAIGMLFLQGWCDYVLPPIDSSPLPFEHCGLVGRWKGQGEGETVYQDFTENGTAVVWRAGYDGRYTIFHTSYLSKNGQKLLFRPMDNPSATGAEVLIQELNCDKILLVNLENGKVSGNNLAMERVKADYFIEFVAHSGMPGHAYVKWIEIDHIKRVSIPKAFGLYPKEGGLAKDWDIGGVPGKIIEETSPDLDAKYVTLRVRVSRWEFERSITMRDAWMRNINVRGEPYQILAQSCVDFMRAIAGSLGDPKLTIPRNLPGYKNFPYLYLQELRKANLRHHYTVEEMELPARARD